MVNLQSDDAQTEPPPRSSFSDTVNQWVIYDAYVAYEYAKELQDEKDRQRKPVEQNECIKRYTKEHYIFELQLSFFFSKIGIISNHKIRIISH